MAKSKLTTDEHKQLAERLIAVKHEMDVIQSIIDAHSTSTSVQAGVKRVQKHIAGLRKDLTFIHYHLNEGGLDESREIYGEQK